MSQNISGFGLSAVVTASNTFPNGFNISDFGDDADPLESPDFTLADTGFGLNGTMLVWSRANGIEIAINVIPNSESDRNLDALSDANRVGLNKSSAQDKIGIVFTYPDGSRATCSEGVIIVANVLNQVSSAGRLKTRQYRFRFEKVNKTRP